MTASIEEMIRDAIDKTLVSTEDALDVIAALRASGLAIVPREPTEEMILAGMKGIGMDPNNGSPMAPCYRHSGNVKEALIFYRAMLAAIDRYMHKPSLICQCDDCNFYWLMVGGRPVKPVPCPDEPAPDPADAEIDDGWLNRLTEIAAWFGRAAYEAGELNKARFLEWRNVCFQAACLLKNEPVSPLNAEEVERAIKTLNAAIDKPEGDE